MSLTTACSPTSSQSDRSWKRPPGRCRHKCMARSTQIRAANNRALKQLLVCDIAPQVEIIRWRRKQQAQLNRRRQQRQLTVNRLNRPTTINNIDSWEVSRLLAQSSGTVYQPLCELQLSTLWCSLDIWRPTCLADWQRVWGLFMTRSTNPLIIIIIIWRPTAVTHDTANCMLETAATKGIRGTKWTNQWNSLMRERYNVPTVMSSAILLITPMLLGLRHNKAPTKHIRSCN